MSMLLWILPLAAGLSAGADDDATASAATVERAHQLLRGTWQIAAMTEDGEEFGLALVRDRLARGGRVKFADRNLVIVDPRSGEIRATPVRLNPATMPRRIDLTSRDDRVLEGIYKIEGEELIVCVATRPGPRRPEEFEAQTGSDRMLIRLKLVPSTDAEPAPLVQTARIDVPVRPAEPKEAAKVASPAAPVAVADRSEPRRATDSEIRRAHDLLSGNWKILNIVDNGESLGPELIRTRFAEDARVTFTHRAASLVNPLNDEPRSVTYRIDPAPVPSRIDMITSFDHLLKGIYEFDGDVLQVCVAKHEDGPRPTEFSAKSGSDRMLYRLRAIAPDPKPAPAPEPPAPNAAEVARRREDTIRRIIADRWVMEDANGTLNVTFWSDGKFSASRVWAKEARGLFGSKTDDSQGRWSFENSRLNAWVGTTTDRNVAGHLFSFHVVSISNDTMLVADALGAQKTLRKRP